MECLSGSFLTVSDPDAAVLYLDWVMLHTGVIRRDLLVVRDIERHIVPRADNLFAVEETFMQRPTGVWAFIADDEDSPVDVS